MAKKGATSGRVPVSQAALVARVNRRLKPDGEKLCASRSARARQDFGPFYIIDMARNAVTSRNFDLEAMARELGALEEWEHLDEAG